MSDKHKFTIHFEVDAETFHILGGLGKVHGRNPNDAARDILLAWMAEVSKTVIQERPAKVITEK